jgi:hypothetical protein
LSLLFTKHTPQFQPDGLNNVLRAGAPDPVGPLAALPLEGLGELQAKHFPTSSLLLTKHTLQVQPDDLNKVLRGGAFEFWVDPVPEVLLGVDTDLLPPPRISITLPCFSSDAA